jgi:putative salt-induced outer membrane protein YdiY
MRKLIGLAALMISAAATLSPAGEVVFKNGDRLTGEVTELGDGKLKIKSAIAGEVTVKLEDVSTFATDKPIEIKLKDGSVLNQPVVKSETPGTVATTQSAAGVGASQIALNQFQAINEPKPVTKWTGNVRAGGVVTRGNSDTETFNLAGDAVRRGQDDRISLNGQYLYGRQKNNDTGVKSTSTDNWLFQGKYDYFFTKQLYGYGVAKFERDRIADLSLRAQPGLGLGYQWWEGPKSNFATEAGIGYTYEDYKNRKPDSTDSYVSARAAYHYDRVLVENVKFINNAEIIPSLEDLDKYNINADAGIRVKISDQFFTDFKVEWKYDSQPSSTAMKNDFRYILSVGWEF